MNTDSAVANELLKSSRFRNFIARLAAATVKAETVALAATLEARLEGSQALALRRRSRRKARSTKNAANRASRARKPEA